MCDLWRNTIPTPAGSIPNQIRQALQQTGQASVLKLYNSGSFFDAGAIPRSDWPEIGALCRNFRHVAVECHPRLVGKEVLAFRDLVQPATLEVAMGLETCHAAALEKLNKRITVEDFAGAARFLRANRILVRTFLLVGVPFIETAEQCN
jgi:radical SAM enzyme (TIGR01210 family)